MMKQELFANGFLVKSYEENQYQPTNGNYRGIGRYISWPLESRNDPKSIELSQYAFHKWFGYNDDRVYAIPDWTFVSTYIRHCGELHIPVFVMLIESTSNILVTDTQKTIKEVLGFDYAGGDLTESAFYDDVYDSEDPTAVQLFEEIIPKLNQNGLLKTLEDAYRYLEIRTEVLQMGGDVEEYYYPHPMRVSIVY